MHLLRSRVRWHMPIEIKWGRVGQLYRVTEKTCLRIGVDILAWPIIVMLNLWSARDSIADSLEHHPPDPTVQEFCRWQSTLPSQSSSPIAYHTWASWWQCIFSIVHMKFNPSSNYWVSFCSPLTPSLSVPSGSCSKTQITEHQDIGSDIKKLYTYSNVWSFIT